VSLRVPISDSVKLRLNAGVVKPKMNSRIDICDAFEERQYSCGCTLLLKNSLGRVARP
jgi:hypothetical protein